MKRIIGGVVLTVAMVVGGASVAEARVTQVTPTPVRVVVRSPESAYRAVLRTNTTTLGNHYASIWLVSPNTGRMTFSAEGRSRSADVPVLGTLVSEFIAPYWGLVDAMAVDDADGRTTPMTLDVRRRSRVTMDVPRIDRGRVVVSAVVEHYNGAGSAGKYIPSKKSPVQLQELTSSGWVLVALGVTDGGGLVTVMGSAGPGEHRYRVRRPDGATVWAAASKSRVVE